MLTNHTFLYLHPSTDTSPPLLIQIQIQIQIPIPIKTNPLENHFQSKQSLTLPNPKSRLKQPLRKPFLLPNNNSNRHNHHHPSREINSATQPINKLGRIGLGRTFAMSKTPLPYPPSHIPSVLPRSPRIGFQLPLRKEGKGLKSE